MTRRPAYAFRAACFPAREAKSHAFRADLALFAADVPQMGDEQALVFRVPSCTRRWGIRRGTRCCSGTRRESVSVLFNENSRMDRDAVSLAGLGRRCDDARAIPCESAQSPPGEGDPAVFAKDYPSPSCVRGASLPARVVRIRTSACSQARLSGRLPPGIAPYVLVPAMKPNRRGLSS